LVPPLDLVDYLIDRKHLSVDLTSMAKTRDPVRKNVRALKGLAITRATWRHYKAALILVLEEERRASIEGAMSEELEVAIRTLRLESQSGCLKGSHSTSGRKLKAFPEADFLAITRYLKDHIGQHVRANALLTWLRAGRLVGVRPSEWLSAGFCEVDGRLAIRFGNGKATNGRSNGSSRTLILDGASDEDIEHLDDMLYMLVEMEKEPEYDFDVDLKRLVDYMRYVTRECLGKRTRYPTMYSLRHQFAADGKLTYSQAEVAALMGHGSDATATSHYGRRAAGQRSLKVAPTAIEVDAVRHNRRVSFRLRNEARKP
jgi:integrase